MPNYLKMPKKQQVLALLELGWSYRRIEAETGVRRETVSRVRPAAPGKCGQNVPRLRAVATRRIRSIVPAVDGPNPAKTFAGSDPNPAKMFPGSTPRPRFAAAVYRDAIMEKLDAGLSLQRDLAGPGRGVRLRRELRVGEALRAHARADAPGGRRLSLRPRRGGAGRFLPRRADARRDDRAVAPAVGVSHDARPLAPRLRGGGLGSEARDVPAAPRARVPRSRRRADASSATTI